MLRNYRISLRVNEVSEAIKQKGLLRLCLAMTVPYLSLICHFIYEKNHLERLYSLEKHINEMKEWPFNSKALLIILTGLVLPLALIVIEYLLKKFIVI